MSWLHYVAWLILIIVAIKAIRFGWRRHILVNKVLTEAGHTRHNQKHLRPLTEDEKRAVLYAPRARQRGRQSRRHRPDPEQLSAKDLDGLDDMFNGR